MNVKLAKTAGFCFGVKRAVNMVYSYCNETNEKEAIPVYTFGPIIHNEEVTKDLESKGVRIINSLEKLSTLPRGKVIIRSHGVSENVYKRIEEAGFEVVDATCPFVKKIHKIVRDASARGEMVIIIGDPSHPEVEGICGWAGENIEIINSENEAEKIENPKNLPITIVSQTTYNYMKFHKLVEIIKEKGYYINIANTICNATNERQLEARQISREVDAMIVIGGRHSSNTQKLYEICKEECENTYYIQTLVDLDTSQLQSIDSIGITAGASTPNNIIEEVQTNVIRI